MATAVADLRRQMVAKLGAKRAAAIGMKDEDPCHVYVVANSIGCDEDRCASFTRLQHVQDLWRDYEGPIEMRLIFLNLRHANDLRSYIRFMVRNDDCTTKDIISIYNSLPSLQQRAWKRLYWEEWSDAQTTGGKNTRKQW